MATILERMARMGSATHRAELARLLRWARSSHALRTGSRQDQMHTWYAVRAALAAGFSTLAGPVATLAADRNKRAIQARWLRNEFR